MIFATGNLNKLREFEGILGRKLDHVDLDLDEIQSVDVEDVARHKALQAYATTKEPVIVEDTGLYFDGLNGLPGALVKFFIKKLDLKRVCDLIGDNRGAVAKTCIVYHDGKEVRLFTGQTRGSIVSEPRGGKGFGWDPIFVPEGYDKTFAELSNEEKQSKFMRREALDKFKKFISEQD
jgi:XTP/dITP diphosphohydrolase